MTDVRKASDVLLSLEEKIKKIESAVSQIDLNVKTILNKLNFGSASVAIPSPKTMITQAIVKSASGLLMETPTPTLEDVIFPQADGTRGSTVEQRVVYSDGRPVILAAVTIADAAIQTNIINKVKTDSHGKWHAQLFGGKYLIEIVKGPTAAKRGFKIEYEIEVPEGGRPLSLDRKQV